jgi:hypothetical protein
MPRFSLRTLIVVMLLGACFSGVSLGWDRKGRLQKSYTTKVGRNDDGRLSIGPSALTIKDAADGSVLSVLIDGESFYLAFPLEKDAAPIPKLVAELGPNCYWARRRIRDGKTPQLSIREKDIFEAKAGPFKHYILCYDKENLLILSLRVSNGRHVARTYEYDNLDDGK